VSDWPCGFLDGPAAEVLRSYGMLCPDQSVLTLGNRGGFSGARLWKVGDGVGACCLRAWPPGDPTPERLSWIHGLMRRGRERGLDFVPAVARTAQGTTWIAHGGRLWDVIAWMPGQADFQEQPTPARLDAACMALARLHGAWAGVDPVQGPCPGIGRRLRIAQEWIHIIESGWCPEFEEQETDPVLPWAQRAWTLFQSRIGSVPRTLATWRDRAFLLHPCLCDIWHDHVLFEGDRVSGLIDYGGVKVDHCAVDLARLLGSLVEDNADRRDAGLNAYLRCRPLSWEEQALVGVLDETGAVIAVANWLNWLYRDGKTYEDRTAVARRLAKVVQRLEKGKSPV